MFFFAENSHNQFNSATRKRGSNEKPHFGKTPNGRQEKNSSESHQIKINKSGKISFVPQTFSNRARAGEKNIEIRKIRTEKYFCLLSPFPLHFFPHIYFFHTYICILFFRSFIIYRFGSRHFRAVKISTTRANRKFTRKPDRKRAGKNPAKGG